jgi:homoserine O-acetyltransferase
MLVKKQRFQIQELKLKNNHVLKNVEIGYETYGTLNATGDNAIFIPHYFSGTSHAAGRYNESDPEPGYWDALIGPGKAIDTTKYFVVSSDSLCNVHAHNPYVITTGPASINPDTKKPYGSSFPVVQIGDFVETQKRLCDSLGIKKLQAVIGPSMGAMQTLEWTAAYPDFVERAVCVIGTGLSSEAYLISTLNMWMAPIRLDPNFKGGDYYDGEPPKAGLQQALKLIVLTARHPGWAQRLFGRRVWDQDRSPSESIDHPFSVEANIDNVAADRVKFADANHVLRIARAVQLFSVEDRKDQIRARFLFLPAQSDLLLFPEYSKKGASQLRELGLEAQLFELEGDGGHLDGLEKISQAAGTIRRFLEN